MNTGWLLFCLVLATMFYTYQLQHVDVEAAYSSILAENKTYKLDLARQHVNLKECMSKLPESEVKDFYKRHREELQRVKQ